MSLQELTTPPEARAAKILGGQTGVTSQGISQIQTARVSEYRDITSEISAN